MIWRTSSRETYGIQRSEDYKYFNNSSIKHAKPLLYSARCMVRHLSLCSLRSRHAYCVAWHPAGAPFKNFLLHLFSFKTPTLWAVMSGEGVAYCASLMRNGVKILFYLHFKTPPIEVVQKNIKNHYF